MFKSKEEKEALFKGYVIVPSSNGHKVSSEYFEDDRRYIPVQNLKNAKCPVLILHGDKDRFVNYKDSEYVHKVVPNSMLYLIPNGDHSFKDEECMNKACQKPPPSCNNSHQYQGFKIYPVILYRINYKFTQ